MPDFNQGWWIRICPQKTKSNLVALQCGPDRDDNIVWAEWHPGEATDFRLPDEYQGLDTVYVQATCAEREDFANLCVYYSGQPKKNLHFEYMTSHNVSKISVDICDC